MITRVRRFGVVGVLQDAGIGLAHHPFAVVDADQVLLEDVVVEHVLGSFTEIDDPLAEVGGLTPYAMFCA